MATYSAILDAEVSAESPVTVSLMTRLRDNALAYLGAPSGTKLLCPQAAAPLGWTRDTTHNDKALRVVAGAGGGSGGTRAFSTVFGLTNTDNTSPTSATMFSHSHQGAVTAGGVDHTHPYSSGSTAGTGGPGASGNFFTSTGANTSNASEFLHTHGINAEGSAFAHRHGMDITVQYVDTQIVSKD